MAALIPTQWRTTYEPHWIGSEDSRIRIELRASCEFMLARSLLQ
jgi:hypothetical protein